MKKTWPCTFDLVVAAALTKHKIITDPKQLQPQACRSQMEVINVSNRALLMLSRSTVIKIMRLNIHYVENGSRILLVVGSVRQLNHYEKHQNVKLIEKQHLYLKLGGTTLAADGVATGAEGGADLLFTAQGTE